jgi:hypothetical protein
MSYKSLVNPLNADTTLVPQTSYDCVDRQGTQGAPQIPAATLIAGPEHSAYEARATIAGTRLQSVTSTDHNPLKTSEDVMDRMIESAVLRSVFSHDDAG